MTHARLLLLLGIYLWLVVLGALVALSGALTADRDENPGVVVGGSRP